MNLKRLITGMLALLVIALLIAPSLMAQSLVSGDLTGTVTDPSGAVVPNATVTLKNNATGATHNTTSTSSGAYRFSLLPPGNYTVSASAQGFSKAKKPLRINVGQATVANIKLAVGTSSQTVEVTSAAPLVQADNADLSTNFDQNLVANAPNGGNDLTYIAQTAPGINMNTGMGYGNFQTAGLPATSNVFTMNGENQMDPYLNLNNSGATNLMLGKNAVQEATVTTNAYGGQYGQQAGAQVSYVSKSGTNAFHGNANYWWTGSSIQANSWFAGQAESIPDALHQQQSVGSLGRRSDQEGQAVLLRRLGRDPLHRSFDAAGHPHTDGGICQCHSGKPGHGESGLDSAVLEYVQPVSGSPYYGPRTPNCPGVVVQRERSPSRCSPASPGLQPVQRCRRRNGCSQAASTTTGRQGPPVLECQLRPRHAGNLC
jgi:hypothetical protein